MPITADTAVTQILIDNPTRVVGKFLYYSLSGTPHADVMKVNVAALSYGVHKVVLTSRNVEVLRGAVMVGTSSSASSIVVDWLASSNTVVVGELTGATSYTNGETLTFTGGGADTAVTATANAATAFTTPDRNLDITSVWYSVSPTMVVELGFASSTGAANTTSLILSGSGYFGKNALPLQLDNPTLTAPTGNFFIGAPVVPAKTAYSIIVEFRKTEGFADVQ
jgi:hypothetical protein